MDGIFWSAVIVLVTLALVAGILIRDILKQRSGER